MINDAIQCGAFYGHAAAAVCLTDCERVAQAWGSKNGHAVQCCSHRLNFNCHLTPQEMLSCCVFIYFYYGSNNNIGGGGDNDDDP